MPASSAITTRHPSDRSLLSDANLLLRCPRCGWSLSDADIHQDELAVLCPACAHIAPLPFTQVSSAAVPDVPADAPPRRCERLDTGWEIFARRAEVPLDAIRRVFVVPDSLRAFARGVRIDSASTFVFGGIFLNDERRAWFCQALRRAIFVGNLTPPAAGHRPSTGSGSSPPRP